MKFDVYCDESHPDLFASGNPQAQFMVIGSLWLPTDSRGEMKEAIHSLRDKHRIGGEFKWQKVSRSRELFYQELASYFLDLGDRLRFRCIAVDHAKVNLVHYHANIVIFDLTSDTTGEFVTALADRGIRAPGRQRTIDQIRSAPKWE